jgi:hypothetical protein
MRNGTKISKIFLGRCRQTPYILTAEQKLFIVSSEIFWLEYRPEKGLVEIEMLLFKQALITSLFISASTNEIFRNQSTLPGVPSVPLGT